MCPAGAFGERASYPAKASKATSGRLVDVCEDGEGGDRREFERRSGCVCGGALCGG